MKWDLNMTDNKRQLWTWPRHIMHRTAGTEKYDLGEVMPWYRNGNGVRNGLWGGHMLRVQGIDGRRWIRAPHLKRKG